MSQGFESNPCNPCVVNKTVDGKQMTMVWHVNDLKSCDANSKVNNEFYE